MRDAARRAKREIIRACGGGSHRRRRIAREVDQAARTPASFVRYIVSAACLLPDPRPGPRRRGGLG